MKPGKIKDNTWILDTITRDIDLYMYIKGRQKLYQNFLRTLKTYSRFDWSQLRPRLEDNFTASISLDEQKTKISLIPTLRKNR